MRKLTKKAHVLHEAGFRNEHAIKISARLGKRDRKNPGGGRKKIPKLISSLSLPVMSEELNAKKV